jgi:hypothetical protein
MTTISVTITLEDGFGVFFKQTVSVPREELISGLAKPEMKTIVDALVKVCNSSKI